MEQKVASRRQRKREKVAFGPGPREYKAGHETSNCGELRVRWRGLCALSKGGGQNTSVPRRVVQTEHCPQKTEKERGKVAVEPGPEECTAGHETNNCGELRVRWSGLCALGNRGGQNMGVSGGCFFLLFFANRAWFP